MTTAADVRKWQSAMGDCGAVLMGATRDGRCKICGDETSVSWCQFWDCDDGWRVGNLCTGCYRMARARGPRLDDYAVA